MEKDLLDDSSKVLGILGSLGVAAGVKWGYKRIKQHLINRKMRREASEAVLKMLPQFEKLVECIPIILELKYQFSQNGGGNLYGRFERMEDNQNFIIATITTYQSMNGLCDWKSDANGKCVFASDKMCHLVGRSQTDMYNNNWAAWVEPEVFVEWRRSIDNLILFDMDYSFKLDEGGKVDVHGYAEHIIIDGKYYGSIGKLTKR